MLTKDEAAAAIASKPHPKVTLDQIMGKIAGAKYLTSGTLTICVLTLENGFTVTGTAACADPRNFDPAIGERVAYDDAVRQVWPLEGYLLRERLHSGALL